MPARKHIWRLCSIYLATTILLLHTFIPHTHTEDSDDTVILTCDRDANCILDILGLLLDHDFAEDHLENFQSSDEYTGDIVSIEMIHSELPVFLESEEGRNIKTEFYNYIPEDPPFHLQLKSRGPPIYS